MKKGLILAALALLGVLAVIGSRRDAPVAPSGSDPTQSPSFEVQVLKPRSALPLFGLVPSDLFGTPGTLGFDASSPGAKIRNVGPGRIQLSADGWNLTIETDQEGKITSETHLVFQLALGGKDQNLRCRPESYRRSLMERLRQGLGFQVASPSPGEDRSSGRLHTRETAEGLSGNFQIEFGLCENALNGKTINWPPAPLTVLGSFSGAS